MVKVVSDSRAAAAAVPRAEPETGGELHVRGVHARVVGRRSHGERTCGIESKRRDAAQSPAQAPKRPSAEEFPSPCAQTPKTLPVEL